MALRRLAGAAALFGAAGGTAAPAPLRVAAFSVYPGYAGNLAVTGSVQIGQHGDGNQVLSYRLAGADPACGATQPDAANACGIHVHAGTSCADAQGHLYAGSLRGADPWLPVFYSARDGDASGAAVGVTTGLALADIEGRAFVVHDSTGGRVACGVLERAEYVARSRRAVASFAAYPGYAGSLAVSGDMSVWQVGTGGDAAQAILYSLTGADPACGAADTTGVANACGIHVHNGLTCSDASLIGGHHYHASAANAEDPWAPISYAAPGGAATGLTPAVTTGADAADITGRAMVVHDASGARIACGIIEEVEERP